MLWKEQYLIGIRSRNIEKENVYKYISSKFSSSRKETPKRKRNIKDVRENIFDDIMCRYQGLEIGQMPDKFLMSELTGSHSRAPKEMVSA